VDDFPFYFFTQDEEGVSGEFCLGSKDETSGEVHCFTTLSWLNSTLGIRFWESEFK
jgi:hypothetical protein